MHASPGLSRMEMRQQDAWILGLATRFASLCVEAEENFRNKISNDFDRAVYDLLVCNVKPENAPHDVRASFENLVEGYEARNTRATIERIMRRKKRRT